VPMSSLFPTAALCIALASPAFAVEVEVPANDGWVTDLAGMLSAGEEQSLEALMESYRSGTSHEIALLIVPDLGGEAIENYALETARAWKIGGQEANNGALVVVSRDDRKIRIEVGRGLEGNLTDSVSGRIIRDVIAPPFKEGNFFEGLFGGIKATHAAIGGDYGPIRRSEGGQSSAGGAQSCFSSIIFLIVFASLFSRRGRRGLGGALPWILLGTMSGGRGGGSGFGGGGSSGGGFGGFGGGGGFSGGGASGGW
jgi:uncharacterized protein